MRVTPASPVHRSGALVLGQCDDRRGIGVVPSGVVRGHVEVGRGEGLAVVVGVGERDVLPTSDHVTPSVLGNVVPTR